MNNKIEQKLVNLSKKEQVNYVKEVLKDKDSVDLEILVGELLQYAIEKHNTNIAEVVIDYYQTFYETNKNKEKHSLEINQLFDITMYALKHDESFSEHFVFLLDNKKLKNLLLIREKNDNQLLSFACTNGMIEIVYCYLKDQELMSTINQDKRSTSDLLASAIVKKQTEIANLLIENIAMLKDIKNLTNIIPSILEYSEKDHTDGFRYLVFEKGLKTLNRKDIENLYIEYVEQLNINNSAAKKYLDMALDNAKENIDRLLKIYAARDLENSLKVRKHKISSMKI